MKTRILQQLTLLLFTLATIVVPLSFATYVELETHQYFVDQSFSRQYVCSEEELECFKKNQVLYENDGKCYSVGEQGPCKAGQMFHADKKEASRRGGHLRGTCSTTCKDPSKSPVAATGECLTRIEVISKICREDWYLRPAMDAFGQWVCEWTELLCNPPDRTSFGSFYGDTYTGICSAPEIFKTYNTDGKNATVPAEKPTDHPWLQYFTNKSYIDREYPCTEEEKACLQYGRILHSDGNCYSPGQWSAKCEPGQIFHLDWDEAMREGGRLKGTCRSPCKNFQHPQIGSGKCQDYGTMSKICRWEWGLSTEQNVFGQMACSCGWTPSAPPTPPPSLAPPASAPGLCRVPDFSNPVRTPSYDMTLTMGFRLPCSEKQFACLREGRVFTHGACHALRTQGPCLDGQELVLHKGVLANERLGIVCKERPCPEGSVRLPIDGKCLTHQQVISTLCLGQKVALDEFGGWQCNFDDSFPGNLSSITFSAEDSICDLPPKFGFAPAVAFDSAAGASAGPAGGVSGGRPTSGFAAGVAPGGFGGGSRPHNQGK